MIAPIKEVAGGRNTMNENMISGSTPDLALAAAAIQRLNCRVSMLDSYARNVFFQSKLRLSEILCRQGCCTWREIQHRENGESLCRMYFRLGHQANSWSVPTRKLHFDVSIKNPPAAYEGEPADETKVAMMSDQQLMSVVVNLGNPPPIQPMPAPAPVQDSEEQQLAWLKEFHDKNGKWPTRYQQYPHGNPLGAMAHRWRARYRQGSLEWHIVTRLNKMKFPWDGQSADWHSRFMRTYEFLKAKSRWPSSAGNPDGEESELAEWIFCQRSSYVKGDLSPKKKWLLDSLNFDWGGYSRHQNRYKKVR